MDYLIMMSEKYLYFKKRKKYLQGHFFPPFRTNWIHLLWKYIWNYVFFKDMYKNLKEIGITQAVSKLSIFVDLWISKLHTSLH